MHNGKTGRDNQMSSIKMGNQMMMSKMENQMSSKMDVPGVG